VKREFLVTVACAAIIVAGLASCSSNKSNTSTSTSSSRTATASAGATAAGTAKVVIDGQNEPIGGEVACEITGGNVNIEIGDATEGIGAVLSDADQPQVKSVSLGDTHGVELGYQSDASQGNAQAIKDGKSYKITGTATGEDMSNPLQPVTKPFEIDVTCP
jgi:lipoprotein LpqH